MLDLNTLEDVLSPIVNPGGWAGTPGSVVVNAEDLPILRAQLELKLKMAQTAEEMSKVVMRNVQERLEDIAEVEQILADRQEQ